MFYYDFTEEMIKDLGCSISFDDWIREEYLEISQRLQMDIDDVLSGYVQFLTGRERRSAAIAPVLKEVERYVKKLNTDIVLVHERDLNFDDKRGLNGKPDFIIGHIGLMKVEKPLLIISQANKGEIIEKMPQCMAPMYAAKEINKSSSYGVVTDGKEWMFIKLIDNTFFVNKRRILLHETNKLFGTIVNIVLESLHRSSCS